VSALELRILALEAQVSLLKSRASGLAKHECLKCGETFLSGAGTGRRLDAKFCSDAHRIAYNSFKRTEQKGKN
jgi:hypothetical protein